MTQTFMFIEVFDKLFFKVTVRKLEYLCRKLNLEPSKTKFYPVSSPLCIGINIKFVC